jgi:hypothetical protein
MGNTLKSEFISVAFYPEQPPIFEFYHEALELYHYVMNHVMSTTRIYPCRRWILQLTLTRAERWLAAMMKLRRMSCAEYFTDDRHFEDLNLLPINVDLHYLPTPRIWTNGAKRSADHHKSTGLSKLRQEESSWLVLDKSPNDCFPAYRLL